MGKFLLALTLILSANGVWADTAKSVSNDPVLEKRVMNLAEELRCLVCQNQTLADSHAELAIDLKNQVREKMAQGMSDKQVVDYMVQRYGDFVLYRPPVKSTTWLLWFGPFLLLLTGLLFLAFKLRNPRKADVLADEQLQRGAHLLAPTQEQKDA